MKGIKIFLIIGGLAFLFLIFLAVMAVVKSVNVQKSRPLTSKTQQPAETTQTSDLETRRLRR